MVACIYLFLHRVINLIEYSSRRGSTLHFLVLFLNFFTPTYVCFHNLSKIHKISFPPFSFQSNYQFISCMSSLINFGMLKLTYLLQVGSIEGRVGVHHLDDSQQGKNFTFKCHREGNEIYSVNSLNFHPVRFMFHLCLTIMI